MPFIDPELDEMMRPQHEPTPRWMIVAIVVALLMLLAGMWHAEESEQAAPAVHPASWRV